MKSYHFISTLNSKKVYLIIGLFCAFVHVSVAQDQEESDRLETIYKNGDFDESEELNILRNLVESETDVEKMISYSLQLILVAKEKDSVSYEYSGYMQKGNGHKLLSDVSKALESYFEALDIAKKNSLITEEASVNIAIADVYSIMGDEETSFQYYRDGLKLMESGSDRLSLAYAQFNFGDEYLNVKELDSALYYLNKAGKIFDEENDENGKAYYLGNLGLVYAEKDDNDKAETNINEAIELLEKLGDFYGISIYLSAMADIYASKNENGKAYATLNKSLDISKKHGLKDQISEAYFQLSDVYGNFGNPRKSLEYYKLHIVYRDSVRDLKSIQKLAKTQTDYQVSEKQLEVDLVNQQKKTQRIMLWAGGVILVFIGFLANSLRKRNKFMKTANRVIAEEKQRSDDLLTNILPEETAEELKEHGEVKAKQFDSVSVLFTDFKGFTEEAGKLSPEKLVESINYYFSKFDEIIKKYELEKIKTIGDAYMCAGGLPFPVEDHTAKMCQAALEITEFVKKTKRSINHKLAKFDIRVGINTGSVVAGVVGTTKFQYDIWGDAVNIAARMESSGEPGKVNISESTYQILKNYDVFQFTPRGEIEAKGKGKIQMYFVDYVD
ncbi:adenylate/guanylate cyclase domain-containing protein [Psychroserpens sp.]|uniref:adenylate/guanylate cyclase domain-containing protein n=1 Tax=Psychroserpens sp. TaxID=2020870 RepID=UPI0038589618